MKATGIIAFGMAGVLSACVGMPATEAPSRAAVRAGDLPVTVDGNSYAARVFPGVPGSILTPGGMVAANGLTVGVRPLAPDQGKVAKAAAMAACQGQGGTFNPSATGRFAGAETWEFRGACA